MKNVANLSRADREELFLVTAREKKLLCLSAPIFGGRHSPDHPAGDRCLGRLDADTGSHDHILCR